MLKRITIENFRGFKQLDIAQDLGPVTVLMGPNSSGKTTVLHAIRLACQMMDLALDSDAPVRVTGSSIEVANNTLVESPSHLLPLADWQALFVDQLVSEGTTSTVVLTFDDQDEINSLRLVLSYARNRQLKFSLTVDAPQALPLVAAMPKKSPKVSTVLTAWLRQHAPRAVFIPPFYGVVREEEYRPRVVVDKLVGSGDQSHVVRNLITGLEPHQLTRLNAFLTELIGASISYRTSGDKVETESPLRVEFQDTNGGIEVSAAGAGLVNLIALYASLARWQANAKTNLVMFLLDEPEAHLHPRLQGSTAQRMVSLVTQEFGAQLFMATHSVEIINRLGDDPATTLLRTDRAATPSATVLSGQAAVLGDLSHWADLTPFTAINFMASRRVLFHEGKSDAKVLRRCAELRFRQQGDKRRSFERWALVPLDGSGNDRVVGLLQRLLASPVWATPQGVPPFNVVTVLDRDYTRLPGFLTKTKDAPLVHSELVWSMHSIESIFLTVKVLGYWIRAFAGACAPTNLDEVIAQALAQVDDDESLKTEVVDQLMLRLLKQPLTNAKGVELAVNTDSHRARAMVQAREQFEALGPAVLQRGKDRSAKVLGFVRSHVAQPKQNSFPTDLTQLMDRVDLNEISDPVAAIPHEMLDLLDRMAELHGKAQSQ
jgi:hypothetical protein